MFRGELRAQKNARDFGKNEAGSLAGDKRKEGVIEKNWLRKTDGLCIVSAAALCPYRCIITSWGSVAKMARKYPIESTTLLWITFRMLNVSRTYFP